MGKPTIGKRALYRLRSLLFDRAENVRNLFMAGKLKGWAHVEMIMGIEVPDTLKQLELTYSPLTTFLLGATEGLDQRLQAQMDASRDAEVRLRLCAESERKQYGEFTAFREQQPVINEIMRRFSTYHDLRRQGALTKNICCAALNDGGTGSGKTVIAGGIINELIANPKYLEGRLPFAQFMILTPSNVVETYRRILIKMGLEMYLDTLVHVLGYSQLTSKRGQMLWTTEEEDFVDGGTTISFKRGMEPLFAVFDECQTLGNQGTKRTKAITDMIEGLNCPFCFLTSATPFDVPLKSQTFLVSARARIANMKVTTANFGMLISTIAERPNRASAAAAERLRAICAPFIVSTPAVKWPHVAKNRIRLCQFEGPEARSIYNHTEERLMDRLRLTGREHKAQGPWMKMQLLQQYAKSAEPLRMWQFAQWMLQDVRSGDIAPVCGVVYRDSLAELMIHLERGGIRRSDVSILWGGAQKHDERYFLTPEEREEILRKLLDGEELDPDEHKALEVTVAMRQDAASHGEMQEDGEIDMARRQERQRVLERLGLLSGQTRVQRQSEIDRFQDGITKILIFTSQTGGVGLSFDRWANHILPRTGYFPPLYSGPQYQQMLGRLVRRPSVSGAFQYTGIMEGTVEETHIAAILSAKLEFINVMRRSFNPLTIVDAIAKAKAEKAVFKTEEELDQEFASMSVEQFREAMGTEVDDEQDEE